MPIVSGSASSHSCGSRWSSISFVPFARSEDSDRTFSLILISTRETESVVADGLHVHNLPAMVLYCLRMDHTRLAGIDLAQIAGGQPTHRFFEHRDRLHRDLALLRIELIGKLAPQVHLVAQHLDSFAGPSLTVPISKQPAHRHWRPAVHVRPPENALGHAGAVRFSLNRPTAWESLSRTRPRCLAAREVNSRPFRVRARKPICSR